MKFRLDNRRGRYQMLGAAMLATLLLVSLSPSAMAQHDRRAARPQWHGDIARFHEHDWRTWHGGHWAHDRHNGRLGWWWVVGDFWYLYPMPVYPYPNPWEPPGALVNPQVDVVPPAPPTAYWYYCEASRNYYPYVHTCPGGWKPVPATP